MKIGVDFDNTIVSYDKVFHKVALEQSLIKSNLNISKIAVRDYLRDKGQNNIWTELQGYVYGERMLDADIFPGFINFLNFSSKNSIGVLIISHKTVYQRFMIVAAGPIANFLFAIICYTFLYTFIGKLNAPPVVSSVEKNSPAEIADVRKDDKILKVNNKIVNSFYDIRKIIYLSRTDFIDFEILRDNNIIVKSIKPTYDQKKQNVPKIGIYSPEQVLTKHPFYFSLYLGIKDTYEICSITLKGLHLLIIGEGSKKDIGGPLKIAEISGKVLEAGFLPLIKLIIILSITIGLINLFPIPILDGGHLALYVLEILFGQPVNKNAQEIMFKIGFAIIVTLAIFLTYNDIINLFKL